MTGHNLKMIHVTYTESTVLYHNNTKEVSV